MPKTITVPELCPIHNVELVRTIAGPKCPKCLFNSNLTWETQRQAIARYNKSEEGRAAAKKYEQSDKGKTARERYLKSDKYKAARRAYNERLRESLAMARAAQSVGERAKRYSEPEVRVLTALEGLMAEIRQYIDVNMHTPSIANVIATAKRDYNTSIEAKKAQDLIDQVVQKRKGKK